MRVMFDLLMFLVFFYWKFLFVFIVLGDEFIFFFCSKIYSVLGLNKGFFIVLIGVGRKLIKFVIGY